jgi:hypothetical protein
MTRKTIVNGILSAAFLSIAGAALTGCPAPISASPSGHYVQYNGETLMLIGDSGTQCVTQNANLDYRAWIDDCAGRGIRMVHVWSFMAPRQTADGTVLEERWGYVYPGITPWARKSGGPLAADGLPQWNLKTFDEGRSRDPAHYWSRLRGLCRYAKSRHMLLGITVFTGWAKYPENWAYHPFNRANGGPLTDVAEAVHIESPGVEVFEEDWSEDWPSRKKTQWIWERFSAELIEQVGCLGNVFFVFLDEHSYDEGNLGDHFRAFFQKRGMVWVDWDKRRPAVDFVFSDTVVSEDKNKLGMKGFGAEPVRPYFLLEGEPYQGDGVRTSLWTFSVGGGHYTFHADTGQETVRTGIMGYDPRAPGADKGMDKRDWLGHASRFFNEYVDNLDSLTPHNELVEGATYCLANPGHEYVVYAMKGETLGFSVKLEQTAGDGLEYRFFNPRDGSWHGPEETVPDAGVCAFNKPDADDWVLHIVVP